MNAKMDEWVTISMRSEVSNICPYCDRPTLRGSKRTIMPDRNLHDRWWHDRCMVRFISDNTKGIEFDANEYVAHLRENLTELIKEVNVRERPLGYKQAILAR
jgi:hypothetical protein